MTRLLLTLAFLALFAATLAAVATIHREDLTLATQHPKDWKP